MLLKQVDRASGTSGFPDAEPLPLIVSVLDPASCADIPPRVDRLYAAGRDG